MNELTIFKNENLGQVRVVDLDGEPWFVAKDVCDVFGETNRNRAMQNLGVDEKGYTQMMTPGGMQETAIVNESGLYGLLFAMQPTKARGVTEEYIAFREQKLRQFRKWVTSEVLPSIRKHGAYMTDDALARAITDPDFLIRLATELKDERALRHKMQDKIESDMPKVVFADAVAASHTSILIGDLAKLLRQNGIEIGQKRLFTWLRDNGYLIKRYGSDYNMPMQRYMEMGLFDIKETAITHADGHVSISKTVKITGKGQQYFINKFLSNGSKEVAI